MDASPIAPEVSATDPGSERLNGLKRDIALNQYAVDAAAVAEAILSKLQLVKQGHLALAASAADQTPPAGGLRPPGR
jgi:hypothetical protein